MKSCGDLVQHKIFANNALLKTVKENEKAAQDRELHELLHHIILANRFWFSLILGRSFAREAESKIPDSLETLETPFISGGKFSVAEACRSLCIATAIGTNRPERNGASGESLRTPLWRRIDCSGARSGRRRG